MRVYPDRVGPGQAGQYLFPWGGRARKQPALTGIILAGGKSTRMNTDKALLSLGELSILEKTAEELLKICSQLIIVSGENSYEIPRALQVADLISQWGPLGGIYTGLFYTKTNYNMIVACDMPRISASLAGYLAGQAEGYQVVVPCRGGYYEPLAALYHRDCLPVFQEAIQGGERKVTACYSRLKVKAIPGEALRAQLGQGDPFLNLNTPEEWELYRRQLSKPERE